MLESKSEIRTIARQAEQNDEIEEELDLSEEHESEMIVEESPEQNPDLKRACVEKETQVDDIRIGEVAATKEEYHRVEILEKENKRLAKEIETDSEGQFDSEQIGEMKDGFTPRGYSWSYVENEEQMYLVKTEGKFNGIWDKIDFEHTANSQGENEIIDTLFEEEQDEFSAYEQDEEWMDPEHSLIHLPSNQTGQFTGEIGNSEFIPAKESALKKMADYGRASVEYKDNYPDFTPFSTHDTPWGKLDTKVEIGHMTDQRSNPALENGERRPRGRKHDPEFELGNFAQADNELCKRVRAMEGGESVSPKEIENYREENGLTWHECADGKTMQLIPRDIHSACPHSGGVSEMKYRQAWGDITMPE